MIYVRFVISLKLCFEPQKAVGITVFVTATAKRNTWIDLNACCFFKKTNGSCTSLYGHMNSEKRGLFFTCRAACEIPLAIMLRPCESIELK